MWWTHLGVFRPQKCSVILKISVLLENLVFFAVKMSLGHQPLFIPPSPGGFADGGASMGNGGWSAPPSFSSSSSRSTENMCTMKVGAIAGGKIFSAPPNHLRKPVNVPHPSCSSRTYVMYIFPGYPCKLRQRVSATIHLCWG